MCVLVFCTITLYMKEWSYGGTGLYLYQLLLYCGTCQARLNFCFLAFWSRLQYLLSFCPFSSIKTRIFIKILLPAIQTHVLNKVCYMYNLQLPKKKKEILITTESFITEVLNCTMKEVSSCFFTGLESSQLAWKAYWTHGWKVSSLQLSFLRSPCNLSSHCIRRTLLMFGKIALLMFSIWQYPMFWNNWRVQSLKKYSDFLSFFPGAISSEEIIKYAHRISASNAVCAPLTWVPGK